MSSAVAAVVQASSPASPLCLPRAVFSYGSLSSVFSRFLHRQPRILPEGEVYLPPDDFKSSRTVFNPLHVILFQQRKTHKF